MKKVNKNNTSLTKKKVTISLNANLTKKGKSKIRGILNGLDFNKHRKLVTSKSGDKLKTRNLRLGSPSSLILPSKISSSTYDTKRFKEISFTIGNKLPQVLKQVYHNDFVLNKGTLYGFEKKRGKLNNTKYVDFTKADVTFTKNRNVITLTNFINNKSGKVYKLEFSTIKKADTWFQEVISLGIYTPITSYQKI